MEIIEILPTKLAINNFSYPTNCFIAPIIQTLINRIVKFTVSVRDHAFFTLYKYFFPQKFMFIFRFSEGGRKIASYRYHQFLYLKKKSLRIWLQKKKYPLWSRMLARIYLPYHNEFIKNLYCTVYVYTCANFNVHFYLEKFKILLLNTSFVWC